MKKTNYLWLGAAIIIIILVIYLIMSFNGSGTPTEEANNPVGQGNNVVNPESAGTEPSVAANTPATPLPVPGSQPEDAKPAPANGGTITVSASNFSPKNIGAKLGSKVMLTFSATDSKRHTFAFNDPSLSFILVTFSKSEGDKTISFPVPKAGSYEFYIDTQSNKGTLNVQ